MSSIVQSVSDLVKSFFEVIYSLFATAVNVVVNFFQSLVDLAGGLVQFIFSNILILGVIAAAVFGFLQYQRSQGNTVKVGNKKLN
ncbi:hypothetical protein BDV96DRAFT_684192 [Lophiotrema nucula]|uniref:Uncharacterized protein n=1 Tax=Lophiotrema nucula TaxID=690887 RepID=A0A6A5ZMG5_9PLEO|nr:hypothetical protein BDV96DRAFT_684192 [Lophiotrema nucula]